MIRLRISDEALQDLNEVFPYGIFYTCAADEVVGWAIIDLRRDPQWIRMKLAE